MRVFWSCRFFVFQRAVAPPCTFRPFLRDCGVVEQLPGMQYCSGEDHHVLHYDAVADRNGGLLSKLQTICRQAAGRVLRVFFCGVVSGAVVALPPVFFCSRVCDGSGAVEPISLRSG